MSDLPKHVGPFEVRDRLGHGGMGMVYLAYDPMLDRSVAVKVLRVPDEETRRRFLREARLHAKVQHPHIVNIYAVGEHEGQPYLAMEYIAGSTLAAIVRNGDEVPLARKVTWLAELSAGLDHAHRYGVVHRDVKPSNILIARETGRLRLLDFGIAHGQEAMGMTMAGMVIGTPQYMSPEQITGKPVDARSDIFSVGLVGYELLAGRQAFGGDNVFDISRRIVGEPPAPLASLCREAPPTLLRIIEKCIEKSPDDRYQDARQLERELMSVARRLDPDHTMVSMPLAAPTAVLESQSDGTDPPSTAAAALASRVREAVGDGRLAEAEQLLRDLQARHAHTPGLSGLRVLVEEARQMSQAVELAADAERALSRSHLTEAQALIDDIERLAPSWSGVTALRRHLQSLQNERRIADVVGLITSSLDASRLDDAEPALRELAALAPKHPELATLRSRYHARIAEQQAASLASRARIALQQDQLDDAAALVAEALAIAPGNHDALSVQELVGQRRRAQRLARASQKVQSALDAGQPVAARSAFDQLVRMDPRHPHLDSLRKRVERLERGEEPDTLSGARPLTSPPGGPVASPVVPVPVLAGAGASGVVTAAPPPPEPGALALDDEDEWQISRATLPGADVAADAHEPQTSSLPGWALPVAGVLLIALLGTGGWMMWGRPATTDGDTAAETTTTATADGSAAAPDTAPHSTDETSETSSADAPTPVTSGGADSNVAGPPAKAPGPAPGPAAAALARVQQLATAGRYPEAFAALGDVPGLSTNARQTEQRRLAEHARERSDVARRTATDFRAGTTDAFMQGASRQQLGDDHFKGGRMRQAVLEFARARDAFEAAVAARAAQAGVAPPTVPSAPAEPATGTPAPGQGPAPAADASKATEVSKTTGAAMANWKSEQVQAVVQSFRQAYEARNIAALRRLWPSMDSTTERRFRGTFGIPGELQWIPISQRVVRQPDKATIFASVTNITPLPEGTDRRDVAVTIDVAPQGDALVITSFRQQ